MLGGVANVIASNFFFFLELHYSVRNAKKNLEAMPLATPPSIGNVVDFDQMIRANNVVIALFSDFGAALHI